VSCERTASITVVTGVPRSGTSALMQMLAAGGYPILTDGVRVPDADNPHGYLEYEPIKGLRRDSSWLARAEGRAIKVAHALVEALPLERPYRLILVRRRFDEVLASQRVMLERSGHAVPPLGEDRVEAVFRAQLEDVVRWAGRHGAPLLEVEHASLVADPHAIAAAIAAHLDRDLDVVAMAAAIDPGLYRQRG